MVEGWAGLVLTWCVQVNRQAVFWDHLQVLVFRWPAEVNVVRADFLRRRCLPTLRTWKHNTVHGALILKFTLSTTEILRGLLLWSGYVTVGEGGGDFVDGVTRLCRTPAAVAVTETRQSQTPRILSELTPENTSSDSQEVRKKKSIRKKEKE